MKQEIQAFNQTDFAPIVQAIGTDIEQTQVRMASSANADMLFHYWKIGHFILYLQKKEGWGSKVIDNLSKAIRSKLSRQEGLFSQKHLLYVPVCQCLSAGSTEQDG